MTADLSKFPCFYWLLGMDIQIGRPQMIFLCSCSCFFSLVVLGYPFLHLLLRCHGCEGSPIRDPCMLLPILVIISCIPCVSTTSPLVKWAQLLSQAKRIFIITFCLGQQLGPFEPFSIITKCCYWSKISF